MSPKAQLIPISHKDQRELREKLNLPPHFCTPAVCEHNVQPLTSVPQTKKRKWIVAVRHGEDKEIFWHFSENKDGAFTLNDEGTSRRSIRVPVNIQTLLTTVARASAKKYILFETEPGHFAQLKKEDVAQFLNAALRLHKR